MTAPANLINSTANEQRLVWPMAISVIGHIMLVFVFMGMPEFTIQKNDSARVIDVRLVSLPAAPPASSSTAVKKPAEIVPIVKPSPTIQPVVNKTVPTGPKTKKIKRSMKKKTFKPDRVKKNALKRVKKKVEETRPTPIQKALDRIKNRVSTDEKSGRDLKKPEPANTKGKTGGGTGVKRTLDLLDIYQAEIPFYIQKNWAFSEQLAGGRTDLLAVLVIKIMHDGQIQDIWYEQRSGNRYLDESAYKAIQKSNPLPPLPKGIRRAFIQVGLRFTPSGLD